MEEKKTKISDRIRAFFSRKLSHSFLFPTPNKLHSASSNRLGSAGFSLIELLVVITIIGILAAGFIVMINPAQHLKNSRDAQRKSDLKKIQAALELYRSDQGLYFSEGGSHSVDNCGGRLVDSCGSPNVVYLQSIPKDPSTKNNYYYCTGGCGGPANGYRIYSCLENTNDPDPNKLTSLPGGVSFTCPPGSEYYYVENP